MKKFTLLFCLYVGLYLTVFPCFVHADWTAYSAPSTNADRLTHATVYDSDNDMIYMIGGTPNGYPNQHRRDIYAYNPNSDTWNTTLTLMPAAKGWILGAYYNGNIYIVGGENTAGNVTNTNYIYSVSGDSWSNGAVIPQARACHGTVAWNGNIYVVGGTNWTSGFTTVYRYNIAGNSWSACTSLPEAWDMGGCTIWDNVIYLCGGYNRNDTVTWDSIWSGTINTGNPNQITWAREVELDVPTGNCAATAMDGDVYILGGFDESKAGKDTFLRFSILTGMLYALMVYPIIIARLQFATARSTRTVSQVYGVAGDANCNWAPPNNYYYKIDDPAGVAQYPINVKEEKNALSIAPTIGSSVFTVSYTLSSSAHTSLTLYNILGQRVRTLYEGMAVEGIHTERVSTSDLPSGLYFVRLKVGKSAYTQKLMITR
jgi:hypothetical protein